MNEWCRPTDRQLLCRKLQGALRTCLSPCVCACACVDLCVCACVLSSAADRSRRVHRAKRGAHYIHRTYSTPPGLTVRRRPPQTLPECSAPGRQRHVYKVKERYISFALFSPHLSHSCLSPSLSGDTTAQLQPLHGEQCATVAAACNRSLQCMIGTMLWPSLQHAVATGGAAQSYGSAYVRSEFSATLLR
jgi:hypothetical protein